MLCDLLGFLDTKARGLKQLEGENRELKRIAADLGLNAVSPTGANTTKLLFSAATSRFGAQFQRSKRGTRSLRAGRAHDASTLISPSKRLSPRVRRGSDQILIHSFWSYLMAERGVLQCELRSVFDGELDQLDQEARIEHVPMVIAALFDAQAVAR